MEFEFPIKKVLSLNGQGIGVIDCKKLTSTPLKVSSIYYPQRQKPDSSDSSVKQILDQMGEASSQAQQLKSTITNYSRVIGLDQKIFLKAEGNKVLGFIKVGEKNLFYRDMSGNVKNIKPLCVLDFYVHESMQRKGIGKQIFEKMLQEEQCQPHKLAYDKPSNLFRSFLKKHYNLVKFVPQNNNFVIFCQYFDQSDLPQLNPSQYEQQKSLNKRAFQNLGQRLIKGDAQILTSQENDQNKGYERDVPDWKRREELTQKAYQQPLKNPCSNLNKLNFLEQKQLITQKKTDVPFNEENYYPYNIKKLSQKRTVNNQKESYDTSSQLNSCFQTTSNSYGNFYKKIQ